MTGKSEFYSHYSVVPIRYEIIGQDVDGFTIAKDDNGNIRTIHPKILAGLLKGQK